jgi:hypothetical protein
MKGYLGMVDLRPILGKHHIEHAQKGYKASAEAAIYYGISYIKDADNIPPEMKEFLVTGLQDLIDTNDPPHAFFLKWKTQGRRPTEDIMFKEIDIAKIVYEYKYYEQTNTGTRRREKPIRDLDVFAHIAEAVNQSEGTVKRAYGKYKNAFST